MKIDFDPDVIKKMAENIAKDHVNKMTSNMPNPGKMGQDAGAMPTPPPRPPRMSKEEATSMLSKSSTITCEKCNNYTFDSVFVIKKISALISPNGEESHVPIQAFACSKCGSINEAFLPKEVVDDVAKKTKSKKTKAKTQKKNSG